MNENTQVDLAQEILYKGTLSEGSYEGLDENGLAAAFLYILEREGAKPAMLDRFRYKKSEDKLDYLSSFYEVSSLSFRLEDDWYKKDKGTFIGFLKETGRAVPVERDIFGYHYRDTQAGRYVKITKGNAGMLSGEGIFLYFLPKEDEKSNPRYFLKNLATRKEDLLIFLGLTIFASLLTSLVPSLIQKITDIYIPNTQSFMILQSGVCLLLTIGASFCLNIMIGLARSRFQIRAGSRYFSGLLAKIMAMSPGDEKRLSGRLISLIMNFLGAVNTILSSIPGLIIYLTQCIVVLAVINSYDANFQDSFRVILFLSIVGAILELFLIFRFTKMQREAQSKLNMFRRESVDHIEVLKNYNQEDENFFQFSLNYSKYSSEKNNIQQVRQMITLFFSMLSGFGILVICFNSYDTGYIDQGIFSAILSSFSLLLSYMTNLVNTAADLAQSLCELRLGRDILNTRSEHITSAGVSRKISGKIELRNVFFSYTPGGNPIISDMSLTIQPGEYIGIVGASGSGKSTLMRLLMGFEKPTDGDIYYDDVNMGQYNLRALRRQFGVVMQQDSVYNGSIRMNIGMSNTADLDKVKRAADAAAILDEIEAMPMKFNTVLSSEANVVSGGQKQRIVLARALMNTPKVLFLDEASSAMDNVTQDKVKEKMDALGITRISIAHRLSTIRNCDRILVMERGKIVETGTYDKLMDQKGVFYHMALRNLA